MSEVGILNQRNTIWKIADRHGWDTVHEYLDDPLADSVAGASNPRFAIVRASRKRTKFYKTLQQDWCSVQPKIVFSRLQLEQWKEV